MRASPRLNGFRLSALGLALVHSCAILSAQNPPGESKPAAVSEMFKIAGVVVSAASGTPLAHTRVSIVDTRGPRNALWMITAEDGRFEFNRLNAGKYTLQGARRGFIPTAYEQHEQFNTAIVTGAELDTENLLLRLVPVATITGRVLDESGEPVRNAGVRFYRENHNLGVSKITAFSFASTDDQGSYEFAPVIPGTYFISTTARPWYSVHPATFRAESAGNSFLAVDGSLDVSYPTTYYAGTTDADAATPVPIKGGDHVQTDIHLEPVPSLHLLFHVPENGQNGFTMPVLQKRVFDSLEDVGHEGAQQVSAGTYELIGVPAGRYNVRRHGSAPGEADQTTEMNLTKDGQELDSSPGEQLGSVKLTVKIIGEEKLPQQVSIMLRDMHLRNVSFQPVDANGEIQFEGLPAGKYAIVAVSPSKRYSVVRTSSQGTETSGNSFNLTAGSAVSMSALLQGDIARVEGFAKRSGKAAACVMVVLVPTDPESNIELFRRDQSDLDGSFVLPGVVPGSYTVIAIEDGWSVDWSRPTVLARYTRGGQKLTIGPQGQGSVSLPKPVEVQPR